MFAAAGYVVAAVNYHGSSGFGQKFLSSINGDWGRRELADVEAGTDYMLATGTIDPVSYTHLRAHETVLDLVCRLLLEQKHITLPQS